MKKLLAVAVFVLFAASCSAEAVVDTAASTGDAAASTTTGSTESTESSSSTESTDSTQSSSTDTTDVAAGATDTAATDAAATQPPPTVDTTAPAAQIGSDDWCTVARQVDANISDLELLDFTDPVAVEASYTRTAALIAQIQPIAPPAIAADVAITVEGFRVINAALEAADWNFFNVPIDTFDAIDTQGAVAAYNIEKYNFDVCGVGEDPGEPPVIEDFEALDGFEDDELDGFDTSGTIGDQAIASLVESGFTEAEAACILDGIDIFNPEAAANFQAILEVFTDCGISIDRLAQIGG